MSRTDILAEKLIAIQGISNLQRERDKIWIEVGGNIHVSGSIQQYIEELKQVKNHPRYPEYMALQKEIDKRIGDFHKLEQQEKNVQNYNHS